VLRATDARKVWPSTRTAVRDAAIAFLAALVLRAVAGLLIPWPPYLDASYYTVVAESLAAGNGFNVSVIWAYLEVGSQLPPDASLPIPSNAHWPPLGPLVAAGGMALFGQTWLAGQTPMILISALIPPLAYVVGLELFRSRSVALAAAVLALFPGPLFALYPTIDNFAIFGVAGTAVLYASTRAIRSYRPGRWLVVAGLGAAVAALARIDGVLLTLAPATAWLVGRGWTPWRSVGSRPSVASGVASALAFLLVLSPWLIRNFMVFGSPMPSAGGHMLWITSYNEQFSIGHEVSLSTYLEWGWLNIIGSKLESLGTIAARSLVLLGGFLIVPFAGGLLAFRRRPELAPFIVYFLVLFVVMGTIFTFHAPRGAWYHSAPAWLGFAYAIAIAGIPVTFSWLGRFWRFLARPQTHRFLAAIGLLTATLLSVLGSLSLFAGWALDHERHEAAASFFTERGVTEDIVMYRDAAALHLLSGNPAIAIPYDQYPVIEEVARAYGAQWLVVSRLAGEASAPLGLWDGGAAVDEEGNRADWLAREPAFETDSVRVFEILRGGQ